MTAFHTVSELAEETFADGTALRQVKLANGLVKFWKVPAGLAPDPHQHSEEQFTVFVRGKAKFTVGAKEKFLTAGDCVLIKSNEIHSAVFIDETELISVFVEADKQG